MSDTPCPVCGMPTEPSGAQDPRLCRRCDDALVADELEELRADRRRLMARAEEAESALAAARRTRDDAQVRAGELLEAKRAAEAERDETRRNLTETEKQLAGVLVKYTQMRHALMDARAYVSCDIFSKEAYGPEAAALYERLCLLEASTAK